jgi:oligo-1,6-glucosidase
VLHLHKGTPYVYQGEELGMTNTYFTDIAEYRDIESINHYAAALAMGMSSAAVLKALSAKGRDNARTPMQWDSSAHGGFSDAEPWLPVNPNTDEINVQAAVVDPESVFHHYRRLIDLRHRHPVVVEGRFRLLLPEDPQIWAFTRTLGAETLLVLANCSSKPADVPRDGIPHLAGDTLLLGTHDGRDGLELAPWESRVYLRDDEAKPAE